jgi:putative glutamine amidotransferase
MGFDMSSLSSNGSRIARTVGVTLQIVTRSGKPPVYGHHSAYFRALDRVGLAPTGIVPTSLEKVRELYECLDGILLPGGPDIEPRRYGEEPTVPLEEPDERLDQIELELVEWCINDEKPLLGICRVLQILNVALGGSLYQDLRTQTKTWIDHQYSQPLHRRSLPAHDLLLSDEGWLANEVDQVTVKTNSMHHQGIKELGEGLVASGWSPDDVVEAAWLPGHPFAVAFQGHLEEIFAVERWASLVFEEFARAVLEYGKRVR